MSALQEVYQVNKYSLPSQWVESLTLICFFMHVKKWNYSFFLDSFVKFNQKASGPGALTTVNAWIAWSTSVSMTECELRFLFWSMFRFINIFIKFSKTVINFTWIYCYMRWRGLCAIKDCISLTPCRGPSHFLPLIIIRSPQTFCCCIRR